MMLRLMKNANGRILIHTAVLLSNIIHGRKINSKFYMSAFTRYLNGQG